MTNERGADGCDEGRGMRPATELERMGDRLANSEYRARQLEAQLQTTERVMHLALDELQHARKQAPPAAVDELIEALQDACTLVATGIPQTAASRDGEVQRWIRTIHKARGRVIVRGRPGDYEANTLAAVDDRARSRGGSIQRPPPAYNPPGFSGASG